MNELAMCGYCCDQCEAFVANVQRKDEREKLSAMWKKYYNLNYKADEIYCDGCRCNKPNAKRIDMDCPVRKCVIKKTLTHCGECEEYPCETFKLREGMCIEEAKIQLREHFSTDEYVKYLSAYDNKTRLDEYIKSNKMH